MKKFIIILVALIGFTVSANAMIVPDGKYCTRNGDNSYVVVSGTTIYLYIDGHYAGQWTITENDSYSDRIVFVDGNGEAHGGRVWRQNGEIYLDLGDRRLKKC